jgi:hypothetical protein
MHVVVDDPTARWIGGIGLALALLSLGLQFYQWKRSGAAISVIAFVVAESASLRIEVASTGRLPVTVRALEVRDYFAIRQSQGGGTRDVVQTSRWSVPVQPYEGPLPQELAPTAFLTADVPVSGVLGQAAPGAPEVSACAWARRGDGKWFSSKPVRLR